MKKPWMILMLVVGLASADIGWMGSWVDEHPDFYYAESDTMHTECVSYQNQFSSEHPSEITAIRLYVYKEEGESWDNFNYDIVLYLGAVNNLGYLTTPNPEILVVSPGPQPENDNLNEDSIVVNLESSIPTQHLNMAIGIQKHDDCCSGGFVMWKSPEPYPQFIHTSFFREFPGMGEWEEEESLFHYPYHYFIQVSNDPEMLSLEPMTWAGIKSSF